MDQSPLVNEEIEAAGELLREFANYAAIESAFWLRPDPEDRCDLYIVSDQIESKHSREALMETVRIRRKLDDPHLESLLVRFVRSDDKRAQAAAELRRRYPNAKAIHYRNKNFADRDTDELYLYPPLTPAPVA